jgi:hypothetical protein
MNSAQCLLSKPDSRAFDTATGGFSLAPPAERGERVGERGTNAVGDKVRNDLTEWRLPLPNPLLHRRRGSSNRRLVAVSIASDSSPRARGHGCIKPYACVGRDASPRRPPWPKDGRFGETSLPLLVRTGSLMQRWAWGEHPIALPFDRCELPIRRRHCRTTPACLKVAP